MLRTLFTSTSPLSTKTSGRGENPSEIPDVQLIQSAQPPAEVCGDLYRLPLPNCGTRSRDDSDWPQEACKT